MDILGIIPARYGSSRFPGKPLAKIGGKSMIRRVYEQASKALKEVYVATDDQRIYDHVMTFGRAIMTSSTHLSGTDRCAEVMEKTGYKGQYIINIQGDEPFIEPTEIQKLVSQLELGKGEIQIATLAVPLEDTNRIHDPNTVKVVSDIYGQALYFSRYAIPFSRNNVEPSYLQHIGIYAYRTDILVELAKLKPSSLEKAESLEQLRWLENGLKIRIVLGEHMSIGIDTPEDLQVVLDKKLWQAY